MSESYSVFVDAKIALTRAAAPYHAAMQHKIVDESEILDHDSVRPARLAPPHLW